MARSMAASRSNRQLSACLTMIASSVVTSFAAPSKSLFAKTRVLSAAFALFQNFTSSLVKSCWLMSHWNSICIANSRDFVRRDTLLAPRLSSGCRIRMRGAKLARQLRHLDGREPRFKSLVPTLESCAINGLLERVTRQHTKDDWQAAVYLRELQSASGLRTNVIVVRRFAAQNTSDGDQRIVLPRRRQFFRSERQFERSRNVHDINILVARPGPFQRIHRRCEKPLGNKTVEAAHHNAKAETRRTKAAMRLTGLYFFLHRQSAPLPLPHPLLP